MEKQMLAALQYDLTVPTCYLFTARFRKAAGVHDDLKVCGCQPPPLQSKSSCACYRSSVMQNSSCTCTDPACCCCLFLSAVQVNQMCEYLSELCLVDLTCARHPLSLLSAAVLHVALTALGRADTYPRVLARHSRYKLEEVLPAAR